MGKHLDSGKTRKMTKENCICFMVSPRVMLIYLIFTIEKKNLPPLEGALRLSYYSGLRPLILNFKKTQVK